MKALKLRNAAWVLAVTAGAYVATSIIAAASALLFARMGLARPDAVVAATLLSFVVFTALSIWAFQMPSATRAWGVLALLTAVAGALTLLLSKT
jgi:protein-S-isoprenylcysteine O-methyltransferase Ste14